MSTEGADHLEVDVRFVATADLVALGHGLPDVPASVHERHLGAQEAGERIYLAAWSSGADGRPAAVGTCVVLPHGCRDPEVRRALPGAGELAALHVASHVRGRGVGAALLLAGERTLVDHGVARSVVCVDDGNPRARSLYLRSGYEPTGVRAEVRYQLGSGPTAAEVVEQVEALVRPLARPSGVEGDDPLLAALDRGDRSGSRSRVR